MSQGYVRPSMTLPEGLQIAVTHAGVIGNLAVHVGDDPARVILQRRQLQRDLHLPQAPLWLAQCHSNRVVHAASSVRGAAADAIVVDQPGAVAAILTADCLPIMLWSTQGVRYAAVHAGWRGLAAGIIERTLDALAVPAGQLQAYIGPAISAAHFEVGQEVYDAFQALHVVDAATFVRHKQGKWLADLPAIAERLLRRAGVQVIEQSGLCTYADLRFCSYRRDPTCGRIATLIWQTERR